MQSLLNEKTFWALARALDLHLNIIFVNSKHHPYPKSPPDDHISRLKFSKIEKILGFWWELCEFLKYENEFQMMNLRFERESQGTFSVLRNFGNFQRRNYKYFKKFSLL